MVPLPPAKTEIDPLTGKPKRAWWQFSKFTKVNLFIVGSIAAGLWSFTIVRDHVMSKRKEQMKIKQNVQEKVKREIKEEAEKAGPDAKKYNIF